MTDETKKLSLKEIEEQFGKWNLPKPKHGPCSSQQVESYNQPLSEETQQFLERMFE